MAPSSPRNLNWLSSSEDQITPWVDLPPELVSLIANSLGLIDLLSLRGVCKDWRLAPSTATAEIESEPSTKPWFILYGETENCTLYDPNDKKSYSINFPELKDATCLASHQGWLLLLREGTIFFFCPFSRARIDLPLVPHQEISNHIAAFSCPPTSSECIVSIINRCDENTMEIYVLKRGDTTWAKHSFERNKWNFGTIIGGIFDDKKETFYYLDNSSKTLTFSLKETKERNCIIYRIVHDAPDPKTNCLPFYYQQSYFMDSGLQGWIELKDDVSISTCGATTPGHKYNILISNECIESSKGTANCQMKGIWIQPRFFQIPTTHSWLI
ncbi:F-box protein-like [Forsythia ovata]|uniref:F-box protein-like n=1 Tax=Forsythia ovata TaxID=205694 RepID=A0ABD1VE16_9LAMI